MVGRTFVFEVLGGLAAVVDGSCDDVDDDEVRTLPGFVNAFSLRSLSSTVMVFEEFEVGGLVTTFRFGTNIAGFLTVGSRGIEAAGCL